MRIQLLVLVKDAFFHQSGFYMYLGAGLMKEFFTN